MNLILDFLRFTCYIYNFFSSFACFLLSLYLGSHFWWRRMSIYLFGLWTGDGFFFPFFCPCILLLKKIICWYEVCMKNWHVSHSHELMLAAFGGDVHILLAMMTYMIWCFLEKSLWLTCFLLLHSFVQEAFIIY